MRNHINDFNILTSYVAAPYRPAGEGRCLIDAPAHSKVLNVWVGP